MVRFPSATFSKLFTLTLALTLSLSNAQAQGPPQKPTQLQSGPMVGYSTMREVMLWVQTKGPAEVWIEYSADGEKQNFSTAKVRTEKATAFTAHLLADQVQPGNAYTGTLYIDGKAVKLPYKIRFQSQTLWQWRTNPPEFTFALGSCNYVNDKEYDRPGDPYGGDHRIFREITKEKPAFMLWLGDNTYLREADWNSMTGIQYRYTHTRSFPIYQELLATTHHYAIWDDHDYGPNNSDRGYLHREKTLQAFKDFWANPSYGVNGQPGITSMFTWGDCDFFLLDNRYHRSPEDLATGPCTQLGKHQVDWLIDALCSSKAPYKFVAIGGMVLSTAAVYENYINHCPEERQLILDAIQKNRIQGVVFLTGDRHHTELTRWEPEGGVRVYDFTVSPLTSGAYPADDGKNSLLVEGTEFADRNYATIAVKGPRNGRMLVLEVKDADGSLIWRREIGNDK